MTALQLSDVFLGLFIILQLPILFSIALPAVSAVLSIFFNAHPEKNNSIEQTDFAVIITVYKNLEIVRQALTALQNQSYTRFIAYIVADRTSANIELPDSRFLLFHPEQPLDSKVHSLRFAVSRFIRKHQAVLVLDADNLADEHVLSRFNAFFAGGGRAIQGRRVAKNLDSVYACLDAFGEYYYNLTQRFIPAKLGASVPLAGSGMAIESGLFSAALDKITADNNNRSVILAEDKEMQMFIIGEGCRIAYDPGSIIYDEKVATGVQVQRQRARWLRSYFMHAAECLKLLRKGIRNLDFNAVAFAVVTLTPPLVLLLAAGLCFTSINAFINPPLFIVWMAAGLSWVIVFLLAPALQGADKKIYSALPKLPLFVLHLVRALLSMGKTKHAFLETEHTSTASLEDIRRTAASSQFPTTDAKDGRARR